MFHIHTQSGLHGAVIESIATRFTEEGTVSEALVLVRRSDAPFESAPYSTHRIYVNSQPGLPPLAEAGHYDLTLEQGRLDLAARAGRI